MTKKIGVIVGSLRKDSYNKKIAQSLMALLPSDYHSEIIEIGQLEFYNEDLDSDDALVPENWRSFRRKIAEFDAFIFVTAEYNRSFPAVIKNALDVGSRPYGKNAWDGKPAFVVSSSIGAISGFGANHHLRQVLVFLNMPTMPQPEAYFADTANLFDEQDQLKNQGTADFFQTLIDSYVTWINRFI